MPAFYAHYHFGEVVLKELKSNVRQIILAHRELFDIGVQGPDLFFYYKPLKKNEVNAFGSTMHYTNASVFFEKTRHYMAKYNDHKDAMLSYLLGFLAHFCLDCIDHPYVAKKVEVSGVSHFAIESEYDRHLMAVDNRPQGAVNEIKPTSFNAMIIQRFFPEFSLKTVLTSIKSIKRYNNILLVRNPVKAASLLKAMELIGAQNFSDHLITPQKNLKCLDSDLRMDKLERVAKDLYLDLAYNLIAFINGQKKLDERFEQTFDDRENIDHIPVFDLKEEKEYEV